MVSGKSDRPVDRRPVHLMMIDGIDSPRWLQSASYTAYPDLGTADHHWESVAEQREGTRSHLEEKAKG